MPFRPQHSLLRVEEKALHTIDTSSVENLFGMWSLFSKTSHAMEDGRRLENLSWRLWNRETFCCNPESQARFTTSPPISMSRKPKAGATNIPVPELSSSLESASSEESDDEEPPPSYASNTLIPDARPELRCIDSCESRSRGREKHITAVDLEKIVISIKETKELDTKPIALPKSTSNIETTGSPSTPPSQTLANLRLNDDRLTEESSNATTTQAQSVTDSQATLLESSASTVYTNDDNISQSDSSEGSSNTEMSTHSVVRGFVPGGAPSSYRSQTHLAAQPTPILKNSPKPSHARSKKKGAMFTIGTSSGEDESSLESHMFRSALSESLKRPTSNLSGLGSKKQTSFKEEVTIGRAAEHSPVFESDDEDDEDAVSESAIEDDEDDSSDWESDQSAPSSVNEKEMFQRVDSRPNLTSRRSLLTTLMHEPDRARALANAASRSTPAIRRSRNTTPNGPSVATSPAQGSQLDMANQDATRAMPIIMTTSNTHQPASALSPRQTRRNMLSTELTESLRKNLLWERQNRSANNLAALRRRHTSNDVKNLKQHPEPGPVFSQPEGARTYTNDYFHAGLQEYHAKGW